MTGEDYEADECRPSSSQADMSQSEKEETITLIKQHPLFPVIELLLKKCDKATWNLTNDDGTDDIKELFRDLTKRNISPVTGNDEIDQLVQNTILVLRTNVVELTKVSDLSKMFRTKYMQSIKKTMNQESMIGLSADSDDDFSPETSVANFGLNPENFATYGLPNFENLTDTFALMNSPNSTLAFPFHLFRYQHHFHNVGSSPPNIATTNDSNGNDT
ncbi:hypothetical protein QR680_002025 [Steinernema hermaphroditum]|uniref:MEIS N-terminal domain-containing protein n=1 Tax=Steinernema hermaphroditum TaxID=289476 RepID=A0AA39H0X6_9BILA|nr:hypothetical protein QR680_002025 [Steinernema hermaphroditum]